MARETALTSAATDAPRSPRMVAGRPSFASAPALSDGSSAWMTTTRPSAPASVRAARSRAGSVVGAGSSLKPTTPAAASEASGARVTPSRPSVTAPYGRDRTADPAAAAAASTRWTTSGRSSEGRVSAIEQTKVKPPCAAAASPVANVSASSPPGSRRCACRSMKPGATTTAGSLPPASSAHSTAVMTPSSTRSEPRPDRPEPGSTSSASSSSSEVTTAPGMRPSAVPSRRMRRRPAAGRARAIARDPPPPESDRGISARPRPAAPALPCAPPRRWRPAG